jgi:hypothetical protein
VRIVERFHRRHRAAVLQRSAVLVFDWESHVPAIIAEIPASATSFVT